MYLLNGAAIVHLKNMTLQENIYYIACHFKLNASIQYLSKKNLPTLLLEMQIKFDLNYSASIKELRMRKIKQLVTKMLF